MNDIKIDHFTAKEAMALVVDYMKLESIQIIEMITLETLRFYRGDGKTESKEWEEKNFDITIADDKAVLEALGVADHTLLKEAETHLFMKMFMRYLHKNRVKTFLLAEDEETIEEMRDYLKEYSPGIRVVETATIETHGVSDDMILNRINGGEVECILAMLHTPRQQKFIVRNRMLLDAKLWAGLGTDFLVREKLRKTRTKENLFALWRNFWKQYITKK